MSDPEPAPIRVLIVDDHSVVRMGLKMFFDHQADIEVVGEAADGSEGVAMARRLEPDVVLMDLLMPNMDGVTAIRKLREAHPLVCLIALTGDESTAIHDEATNAGADDVLVKGQMLEALVDRLKQARGR